MECWTVRKKKKKSCSDFGGMTRETRVEKERNLLSQTVLQIILHFAYFKLVPSWKATTSVDGMGHRSEFLTVMEGPFSPFQDLN